VKTQSSHSVSVNGHQRQNCATDLQTPAGAKNPAKIVWLYFFYHAKHPFICLAKESLLKSGYSVVVLDLNNEPNLAEFTGAAGDDPSHSSAALSPVTQWTMKLICRAWSLCRNSALRRLRIGRWAGKLLWYCWIALKAAAERPDVIVVSGLEAAAIGWMTNIFVKARLVYYAFELYTDQVHKCPWRWRTFEGLFLRNGIDALITQNEQRAKIFVEEKRARVQPAIVHNYKRRKQVVPTGKLREQLKLAADVPVVLYEGVIQPGRWLENLARSAEYLPETARLVFLGEASEWWTSHIEPLRKAPALAKRVLLAPWVPHGELLGYVADADVGVIIYDDSVRNNYYCEPGKLSDYVIAGVPVVAPAFPTLEPVVKRYQIGATFSDPAPEEIARAIKQVLALRKSDWLRAIEAAREDLVWETQCAALERAILGELSEPKQACQHGLTPQVHQPCCGT